MPSGTPSPDTVRLLRLTLTPGLGPILARRVLTHLDGADPDTLTIAALASIDGIGQRTARQIARGLRDAAPLVQEEIELASSLDVQLISQSDPDYPDLLRILPDAPLVISVRGHQCDPTLDTCWPVAIVGSR
ncbi:MAG: hypothetical protein KDA21_00405, partial [Phycisphaerales bacterium]|nr:hypothetical protein [Phycisphaerales bacterium]